MGSLELAARIVVDGAQAGAHRSVRRGGGTEFQQHRPYHPGDDLKYLDWKLLARTDRLHTRQFREATRLDAMLVLDTSASMAFPETGVAKLGYAAILAASLARVIITQGDACGLLTASDGRLDYLPARGGRPQLRTLTGRISALTGHGAWDAARAIGRGAELLGRRGVLLVLSDFYDDEEGTRAALTRAARGGHDVAMLQLLADAELTLPARGEVEFQDLESGARRVVHARAAAESYAAAVHAFVTRCRTGASRAGVDHHLATTADAPASVLRAFLLRRNAAAHAAGAR